MHDSSEMSASGFLTGFLMGTTVGAMAALLLAPKSGSDVRQDLAEGGERLRDRAKEAAAQIESRGARAVDHTRQATQEAVAGVKKAAAQVLEDG